MFTNRAEAGQLLAEQLAHLKADRPVVVALPRGGVPVAYEIARALDAPLDVLLVRKIGAPGHEEYGIGAVADGPAPAVVMDERAIALLGVPASYVREQQKKQLAEIERRRRLWLLDRAPCAVAGRTVVVVDDGIATGGSIRAALLALKPRGPKRLVVAVPVAPPEALEWLRKLADEVVTLEIPPWFGAVGSFYADFHQLNDDEVADLLKQAETFGREGAP